MTVTTNYLAETIHWTQTENDAIHPFAATIDGHDCLIRINDFPDDYLYTLIVDEKELERFDDWPDNWTRPHSATPNRRRKKSTLR